MSRADARSGFTLLEVVVAFMILGLAIAASFDIFSTGFRQSSAAERNVVAVIHAENLLATLGILAPLTTGESAGEIDDTYRWTLAVVPLEDGGALDPAEPRFRPARVEATVLWGDEDAPHSVTLTTHLLVPP